MVYGRPLPSAEGNGGALYELFFQEIFQPSYGFFELSSAASALPDDVRSCGGAALAAAGACKAMAVRSCAARLLAAGIIGVFLSARWDRWGWIYGAGSGRPGDGWHR